MRPFAGITRMICLTFVLSGLAGCSQADGRLEITGLVSLDGQPLNVGSISFRPVAGSSSPSSGATIREGRYTIPTSQGLRPGKYLVTIQAFKETGRKIEDPQAGIRSEIAPVKFRDVSPPQVTVDNTSRNHFDFSLITDH